jgi:hypothetical protein
MQVDTVADSSHFGIVRLVRVRTSRPGCIKFCAQYGGTPQLSSRTQAVQCAVIQPVDYSSPERPPKAQRFSNGDGSGYRNLTFGPPHLLDSRGVKVETDAS